MTEQVDPRVARTRAHILGTASQIMIERNGPLTFPALALRARVSKRTLYVHWGDIETLVIDSVIPNIPDRSEYEGLDATRRLRKFLENLSGQLCGGYAIAVATIIANSIYHEGSRRALVEFGESIHGVLNHLVGTFEKSQYSMLIFPLIHASMTKPGEDLELIDLLVHVGALMLERNDLTANESVNNSV